MRGIRRIRRNFKSAQDKYVVCDEQGRPLYTWGDEYQRKSGMKDLKGFYEVIEELDLYPDVTGLTGETDIEKVSYAAWRTQNSIRARKKFGYARVSTLTQAQQGHSLDVQIQQLHDAGAEEIYQDVYTGGTVERPQFAKLMDTLVEGDTLIVTKLDRIARSVTQGAETIQTLIDRGVKVKILSFGDAAIDNSPTGKLIQHIFLAFAEFEKDMIYQRTQEGKEKSGNYGGRPRKYTPEQYGHAMELLNDHSYKEVEKMTGISKATLIREKKRRANT